MTATSERGQRRPGLWQTVNDRYPGSMITKDDLVPLASLRRPLSQAPELRQHVRCAAARNDAVRRGAPDR